MLGGDPESIAGITGAEWLGVFVTGYKADRLAGESTWKERAALDVTLIAGKLA